MTDFKNYLSSNIYPGRGIIVGMTPGGKAAAAYFIMGRSANSRNRIFQKENENITIYPFDASKVSDPSLIIYSPIKRIGNLVAVTNGDQTDTVCEYISRGDKNAFENALDSRRFEPDSPNFTPRISAVLDLDTNLYYKISIIKSDGTGVKCRRFVFSYEAAAGAGHIIHTYLNDGNPLPSFVGEPVEVKIDDDIEKFSSEIWEGLNFDNKIALAVCFYDLQNKTSEIKIINKYVK